MRIYRHEYHVKVDGTERVRWCRQNLGDRGLRWDFVGGIRTTMSAMRSLSIYIQSDEDAGLYDKHWRFWNVLKGNDQEESYHISQS
jgi:hypothetical protein